MKLKLSILASIVIATVATAIGTSIYRKKSYANVGARIYRNNIAE